MNKFLYTVNHDDFVGAKSKKSVVHLDKLFFELVTQVLPCDWFIEAGAFDGTTSRLIQTILPLANVYAFEANPYNYDQFQHRFKDSLVNYVHLAVSDTVGSTTFKIQKTREGIDIPLVRGNNSILSRTDNTVTYEDVTVFCTTLDNYFVDKIHHNDSIAMWIDLEGSAYQALQGATQILSNVYFLKIEVESYQYWKDQKLDNDICNFLIKQGFVPVLRDFEYQQQYNILFCKPAILESQQFQDLVLSYCLEKQQDYQSGQK
jgi:FkbM family methyltransferase